MLVYYTLLLLSVPRANSLFSAPYIKRLYVHLQVSKIGKLNEIWVALISVLSCVLFVWETYIPGYYDSQYTTPREMFCAELSMSMIFFGAYVVSLALESDRLSFIFSMTAVIDKITVIPVLLSYFMGEDSGATTGFLRIIRVMRLLRLFRLATVVSSASENAIQSQLYFVFSTLASILVVNTGICWILANTEWEQGLWGNIGPDGERHRIQMHDAAYFTAITFGTVGYGDIAPEGWLGRVVLIFILMFAYIVVPYETSKLLRLTRMRSAFAGSFPQGCFSYLFHFPLFFSMCRLLFLPPACSKPYLWVCTIVPSFVSLPSKEPTYAY